MRQLYLFFFLSAGVLVSCSDSEPNSEVSFKYIDMVRLNSGSLIDSTVMGGLSGIDYLGNNQFVVISDDRSQFSSARFYEMSIDFDLSGVLKYDFTKTILLKDEDGNWFDLNGLDPESIRYRSSTDTYFYTSEGGRIKSQINPFVWEMNREGAFLYDVNTPEIFNFYSDKGLRENGGFESLSFENDTIIWYSNELPIIEDGKSPGFSKEEKYPIRLTQHDIKNDKILSQYVYHISPLDIPPVPDDGFYINSVPEILYVDEEKLWVLERSYVTGIGNFVRLFEIETSQATDVKGVKTLIHKPYSAVSKKMILDFSDFDQKIDNIEGMTFGPDFSDGSKSLVFISDDNFNKEQETQLWLFAVRGLE